jgi:hypothetical protein
LPLKNRRDEHETAQFRIVRLELLEDRTCLNCLPQADFISDEVPDMRVVQDASDRAGLMWKEFDAGRIESVQAPARRRSAVVGHDEGGAVLEKERRFVSECSECGDGVRIPENASNVKLRLL